MNASMILGGAVSTLVVILFDDLILTGAVDSDRQSFLGGVLMIRCPRGAGIRRSKRRGLRDERML